MRITAVLLAVLLLFSGPSVAGKAKRQALEACMPTVEFVNGPPSKDEWKCHYYALSTTTGWPKDLQDWSDKWKGVPDSSLDGREFTVLGVESVLLNRPRSPAELEPATRKKVCKKAGDAVLDWKTLCWVFLPVDQPTDVALIAVIIEWVEPTEDGSE